MHRLHSAPHGLLSQQLLSFLALLVPLQALILLAAPFLQPLMPILGPRRLSYLLLHLPGHDDLRVVSYRHEKLRASISEFQELHPLPFLRLDLLLLQLQLPPPVPL
jgi:hypothetical protein